jgi:peroxiredoxin Q/BCP
VNTQRLIGTFAVAGLLTLAAVSVRAEEEKSGKAEVGKPAPAINLPATKIESALPDKKDAKTLSLEDFQGKKNVVLFFFPKALTKGCTIESCGFRDKVEKFAKLDTVVIGISTDTLALQEKFTKEHNLNFPLFADTDKKVAKAYGVLSDRGFASRYTYVIDKKGTVRKIYTKVSPANHPDEVLEFIKDNLAKD